MRGKGAPPPSTQNVSAGQQRVTEPGATRTAHIRPATPARGEPPHAPTDRDRRGRRARDGCLRPARPRDGGARGRRRPVARRQRHRGELDPAGPGRPDQRGRRRRQRHRHRGDVHAGPGLGDDVHPLVHRGVRRHHGCGRPVLQPDARRRHRRRDPQRARCRHAGDQRPERARGRGVQLGQRGHPARHHRAHPGRCPGRGVRRRPQRHEQAGRRHRRERRQGLRRRQVRQGQRRRPFQPRGAERCVRSGAPVQRAGHRQPARRRSACSGQPGRLAGRHDPGRRGQLHVGGRRTPHPAGR